jgi:hypothetical protein
VKEFFNLPIPPDALLPNGKTWSSWQNDIYEAEKTFNEELFVEAHKRFSARYPSLVAGLKAATTAESQFIPERMFSALRASIHDLLRYATYHDLSFLGKESRFDIGRSVRAAIILKWMLTFRPYIFDQASEHRKEKLYPDDGKPNVDIFVYSSEIAAAIYAVTALQYGGGSKALPIGKKRMGREEMVTFLYTLRYRIKHQDSYHALLRRIVETV